MAGGLSRPSARRLRRRNDTHLDVFINCPFDPDYQPIFNAIVYTVVRSGYRARCALETDNAAQNRLDKILDIIGECRFGIHDISRTEMGGDPPLPRFNMPLELGLWFGAHHFGGREQSEKQCIVFDRDQDRYQRFISDIRGQDIHAHGGDVTVVIKEVAGWLRQLPGGVQAGGGQWISQEYRKFQATLPLTCATLRLIPEEMQFGDFNSMVTEYVATLTDAPPSKPAQETGPGDIQPSPG